jgi:hypothetical protein
MHYSIVDPPAPSGNIPRLADDRVGYFISAQKHFDNDSAADAVRALHRPLEF